MRTHTIFNANARIPLAIALLGVMGGVCPAEGAIPNATGVVAQDAAGYMTLDRDDEPLRSGDQNVYYTLARLKKGTVLRTVGESGAYTKVVIPEHIGAMVPATEVEVVGKGKLRLRVDSRLRSPSQLAGLAGAWMQLYKTALPAGTELDIIEPLTNEAGGVVGYRVKAITSPRGELPIAYILTDSLRPALTSEIERFLGSGNAKDSDTARTTARARQQTDPADETTPEAPPALPAPAPEPAPRATTRPKPSTGHDADNTGVDTSLLEEQVTDEPVRIENRAPERAAPDTVITADQARIPTSALEDLEASFERARTLPREELDESLDELLAEFTRTRDAAGDDEALARALDQRIEWIRIRIQTREQRRRIAETLARYDAEADETAKAIERWQKGRAYQLVGRMVTSSVYTGKHLPLLYRVQGIDPNTGRARTIGYIAPKKDQDLRHMLGRVVGVLGVMRDDEALGLRVVEPERVDLMPE